MKIYRKNPQTGFKESIEYSGTIADIPKGWKLNDESKLTTMEKIRTNLHPNLIIIK